MPPAPQKITVDSPGQALELQWRDGHVSSFPLDALRRACPCASCAGGHDRMGHLPDPSLFSSPPERVWRKVRVEAVGAYGLRIIWDDGHDAGIHTWERLRALCPCPACRNA